MGKRKLLLVIGLIITLTTLIPVRSGAQAVPDRRFGMTEAFWLPEEARELGVGWERILFYWREIQPEGPDDWNTLHVLEEWLVEAENQGREVVGLIKNTAPWASQDGSEAGLPKGLDLPLDDPDNLWANYVGRLADYYGPRGVHHWIIWNEPEIAPGVYGFEFAGTAAEYYQMLKIAYKVMKERDPAAVIHLAGLTWWHDPTFFDRLLAIAAADPEADQNEYFFDVISLHIYFRTETIRSIIEEVNGIQARYGLDKPIWINETNAPPNGDPEWPVNRPRFNVDLDQQAWFIVQALALGFASGAERISVYKLLDIHLPPGGESFGLVRPDQSRRPAYNAYKMATRCFGAFEEVVMTEDPLFYQITFTRPGAWTHVAWSRTPAASVVEIEARAESGTLLELSGANSALLPEGGAYMLQLPGQRCDQECLMGGEPLLLLETSGEDGYTQSCLNFLSAGAAPPSPTSTASPPRSSTQPAAEVTLGARPDKSIATGETAGERSGEENRATAPASRQPDSAVATPTLADAIVADNDGDNVSLEVESSETNLGNQSGAIGLWFLGLGAALSVAMTFIVFRSRLNRKA